jgi:hypothetical protein
MPGPDLNDFSVFAHLIFSSVTGGIFYYNYCYHYQFHSRDKNTEA